MRPTAGIGAILASIPGSPTASASFSLVSSAHGLPLLPPGVALSGRGHGSTREPDGPSSRTERSETASASASAAGGGAESAAGAQGRRDVGAQPADDDAVARPASASISRSISPMSMAGDGRGRSRGEELRSHRTASRGSFSSMHSATNIF
jgi:hypothetical protein